MIFHCETFGEAAERLKGWHDWFAWYPKFIPKVGTVWLQTIERRCLGVGGWISDVYLIYEYRLKQTQNEKVAQ